MASLIMQVKYGMTKKDRLHTYIRPLLLATLVAGPAWCIRAQGPYRFVVLL